MNRLFLLLITTVVCVAADAQIKTGLKWNEVYRFDKCNEFRIEFYARNNELMRTAINKTYYQSNGDDFVTKLFMDSKTNCIETVLDKKNEVAIQIYGSGSPAAYYNAGGFKYPASSELKRLDVVPTNETKQILGYTCKKYTYTFKKIFGEVWITDQVKLSNDLGVFRSAKMAAKHNTLSVDGFVMEMTTEDAKGGKTIMKTVSLKTNENYVLNLKGVKMGEAINKVNYYLF